MTPPDPSSDAAAQIVSGTASLPASDLCDWSKGHVCIDAPGLAICTGLLVAIFFLTGVALFIHRDERKTVTYLLAGSIALAFVGIVWTLFLIYKVTAVSN